MSEHEIFARVALFFAGTLFGAVLMFLAAGSVYRGTKK
jgi:hypothetical protein